MILDRKPQHIALVSTGSKGGMGQSIEKAFLALGYEVSHLCFGTWGFGSELSRQTRLSAFRRRASTLLLGRPMELDLALRLEALQPDMLLFLKSDSIHASTYQLLRRLLKKTLFLSFHPDDPWNQRRFLKKGPSHRRALLQLSQMDAVFLWSRELVGKAVREGGAKRAYYLPFAADPELHPKLESIAPEEKEALSANVLFIGSWDEEREAYFKPLAEADLGLAIYGGIYWRTRCQNAALKAAFRGRPLVGIEQSKAALATPLMINVLRQQNKGACNMRTFEIPATGGFMLHEYSEEAAAFFPEGEAAAYFRDPLDLVEKVRYYLAHDKEREAIQTRGHTLALSLTYKDWCERLMGCLEGWAY